MRLCTIINAEYLRYSNYLKRYKENFMLAASQRPFQLVYKASKFSFYFSGSWNILMTQNQDENFKGETEICVLI
jgi:hypothetical protein